MFGMQKSRRKIRIYFKINKMTDIEIKALEEKYADQPWAKIEFKTGDTILLHSIDGDQKFKGKVFYFGWCRDYRNYYGTVGLEMCLHFYDKKQMWSVWKTQ